MATKKYLSLERLTEYDELIKAKIDEGDSSTLSSSKSYTDTKVSNITNGTTVVAEATHAVSADSATTASSADVLSSARTITLAGDASGSVSFDGSKDVSLTVTVKDDSHSHTIANVDGLQTALDGKASSTHNHDTAYDAKGSADTALASAKAYADTAATTVKNDLLNGAGTAYDTLKELGDLIDDNVDAIEALETVAAGKADKAHTHAIADVSGLQTALDGKAAASHGTHVTYSTTAPVMDGTATVGTATTVARSDHKHPTDTSRASKTEFDTHVADTTKHITSTERTNWGTAYTHSQSAHAPSNAEKNQNAFSYVKVGETSVAAETATDTLTLVAGTNVTITPDATNDKITISAKDTNTTYSAGDGISLSGTTFSNSGVRNISTGTAKGAISVDIGGTTESVLVYGLGSAAYTNSTDYDAAGAASTALTDAKTYTDTVAETKANVSHTHSDATTSAAGFMTAAMVTKLNGIAAGANKTTVDSALSTTSTNPVQNKVVATSLNNISSTVSGHTTTLSSHSTDIANLKTAVADIQEVTSEEIQALFS